MGMSSHTWCILEDFQILANPKKICKITDTMTIFNVLLVRVHTKDDSIKMHFHLSDVSVVIQSVSPLSHIDTEKWEILTSSGMLASYL